MNIWDILIIIFISAAVILAAVKMIRDKRRGAGCPGSCSCCSSGCKHHRDSSLHVENHPRFSPPTSP